MDEQTNPQVPTPEGEEAKKEENQEQTAPGTTPEAPAEGTPQA